MAAPAGRVFGLRVRPKPGRGAGGRFQVRKLDDILRRLRAGLTSTEVPAP
jgi:hypothetical protein